jgi:hypothetical protein
MQGLRSLHSFYIKEMTMIKAILLFDGLNFSENMLSFVQRLNQVSPLLATAVFAPVVSITNMWSYAASGATGAPIPVALDVDEDEEMQEHMRRFELLCAASRMPYRIHMAVNDLALPALRHESRFADLLVLSGDSFFNGTLFSDTSQYLRSALHDTECPALVLPEKSTFPTHIIVAYDGSRESIYALKQFAYLFPEMTRMETTIVYSEKGLSAEIPERQLIEELAAVHFENVSYRSLTGTGRSDFKNWLEQQPDTLLVAGSFSRSWLSGLFQDSLCAELIQSRRIPIFIAHH